MCEKVCVYSASMLIRKLALHREATVYILTIIRCERTPVQLVQRIAKQYSRIERGGLRS